MEKENCSHTTDPRLIRNHTKKRDPKETDRNGGGRYRRIAISCDLEKIDVAV